MLKKMYVNLSTGLLLDESQDGRLYPVAAFSEHNKVLTIKEGCYNYVKDKIPSELFHFDVVIAGHFDITYWDFNTDGMIEL